MDKNKPGRIKEPDLIVLAIFCYHNNMAIGYDKTTNDLWFERNIDGDDIEIDGLDTGGQAIRLLLTLTLLSDKTCKVTFPNILLRLFNDTDREGGKKGKACMLYIQSVLWSLAIGSSFSVSGGDDQNSDALHLKTIRFYLNYFKIC